MGDHNARTAALQETETLQEGSFQPELLNYNAFGANVPARFSSDKIINRWGRSMIEFCRNTQLWIMNGRMNGDYVGEFTYISQLGKSVIDYALGDEVCFGRAKRFVVHTRIESDHMPVSVLLDLGEVPNDEDEGEDLDEQINALVDCQTTAIKRFKWVRDHATTIQPRVSLLLPFMLGLTNLLCASTCQTLDSLINVLMSLLERFIWVLLIPERGSQQNLRESNWLAEYKSKAKRALRVFRKVRTQSALLKYTAARHKWKEKQNKQFQKSSEATGSLFKARSRRGIQGTCGSKSGIL